MQPHRFDHITQALGERFSRRAALRTSAALSGLALAGSQGHATTAQEATPTAADEKPEMLFVQTFESGSLLPKEGEDGTFILTLNGGYGRTIGFSDRPERIVGSVPTQQFLDGLGFTPQNPPNAALVFEPSPDETDVVVLELLNPQYDEASQTMTYDVRILDEFEGETGLSFQEEPRLPDPGGEEFGPAQLFIDSCPDVTGCYLSLGVVVGPIPGGPYGQCFGWHGEGCCPCACAQGGPTYQAMVNSCELAYPDQCKNDGCSPSS